MLLASDSLHALHSFESAMLCCRILMSVKSVVAVAIALLLPQYHHSLSKVPEVQEFTSYFTVCHMNIMFKTQRASLFAIHALHCAQAMPYIIHVSFSMFHDRKNTLHSHQSNKELIRT